MSLLSLRTGGLRKRILQILFGVAVLAMVFVAGLAWPRLKRHREYQATARLEFTPPKPDFAYGTICGGPPLMGYRLLLECRTLEANVLASCSKEDWQQLLGTPDMKVAMPWGRTELETEEGTGRLAITVYHQYPSAAVMLANRRATEFIKLLFAQEAGVNKNAVEFLKKRTSELEAQLRVAEQRRDKLDATAEAEKAQEADQGLQIDRANVAAIKDRLAQVEAHPPKVEELPIRIDQLAQEAQQVSWWKALW